MDYEKLVSDTERLFHIVKTPMEIDRFIKKNKKSILLVQKLLKQTNLSVSEKSKLENVAGLLKAFNEKIRGRALRRGGGAGADAEAGGSGESTDSIRKRFQRICWKTVSHIQFF